MANLFDTFNNNYQPTSTFSFQFWKKDKKTKKLLPGASGDLGEMFFLVPPEEYSIQEGYRVTVTKTISSAWVDDFGNDIKVIKMSGSLYSYYIGALPTSKDSNKTMSQNIMKGNWGQAAVNFGTDSGKVGRAFTNELGIDLDIPGVVYASGLDEFFKLRFIVSRFRDVRPGMFEDGSLSRKFPMLQDLVTEVNNGRVLYDDIAIIYHDYDDNNHFEVVFSDFQMSRSKDDPFTIKYSIEMKCLNRVQNLYSGLGEIRRKENLANILTSWGDSLKLGIDFLNSFYDVPGNLINLYNSMTNSVTQVYNQLEAFVSNKLSDYNAVVAMLTQAKDEAMRFSSSILIVETSSSETNYNSENSSIEDAEDPDILSNAVSNVNQIIATLAEMKAGEKYFSNQERVSTYDTNKVINEEDFDVSNTVKSKSRFLVKDRIYYVVQQNDNLFSLGYKFYSDYTLGSIIGEANNLTNKDFENGTMIGQSIIVPLQVSVGMKKLENNLVYFKRLERATPRERQIQILGSDFKLNSNREIISDGTGDISMTYGEDTYVSNIIDRIIYPSGSLAPLHPEFGIPISPGTAANSISLQKIVDEIENQVRIDPRTEYAYVSKDVNEVGDVIAIQLNYKPFNGEMRMVDAGNIIAGLLK